MNSAGKAGRSADRFAKRLVRRVESRTGKDLVTPLYSAAGRLRRLRAVSTGSPAALRAQVAELAAARVTIEGEIRRLRIAVQELRGLGSRVSELADLVTELLIVAARDEPEFKGLIDKYLGGI